MTCGSVQSNERTREFLLAPDLSAWLDRRNLVVLVLEVIQKVDDSRLCSNSSTTGGRLSQSRALLTLLTYCYAAGIYGSQKIVRQFEIDETLRYLCANHRPDAASLALFRRQNRGVIEQCLEKVCLVVWKTKYGNWRRQKPGAEGDSRSVSCCRMDPVLQMQIMFEVSERLNRAERQDKSLFVSQTNRQLTAEKRSESEEV